MSDIPCNHFRHWKNGGLVSLNSNTGVVFIAHTLFCSECGESQVRLHKIAPNTPPAENKPAEEQKKEEPKA